MVTCLSLGSCTDCFEGRDFTHSLLVSPAPGAERAWCTVGTQQTFVGEWKEGTLASSHPGDLAEAGDHLLAEQAPNPCGALRMGVPWGSLRLFPLPRPVEQ